MDRPAILSSLRNNQLVQQSLGLIFTIFLAMLGYVLLVSGLGLILGAASGFRNPWVNGLAIALLALLMNPLRVSLQGKIKSAWGHDQKPIEWWEKLLDEINGPIQAAADLTEAAEALYAWLRRAFPTQRAYLFIRGSLGDGFFSAAGAANEGCTDLVFPAESFLAQWLGEQTEAVNLAAGIELPASSAADLERLSVLDVDWLFPMHGRQQFIGWLALKLCPVEVGLDKIQLLEKLCSIITPRLEQIMMVWVLERRLRETEVLARLAQGVNFTLGFDDLLELIYAQTNQVIPVQDFWISLFEPEQMRLRDVFYLENDERISARENHLLGMGIGLEAETLRLGRPLVVDDYEQECLRRGLLPRLGGLFAWMGAAMMAGSEPVGVISLGSREAAVRFHPEQARLLQAIADQACGAIVKARLIQETERRARQLATLNEVSRTLSSTLQPDQLLADIIAGAADLVGCASGRLLLLDPQGGGLKLGGKIGQESSTGSELLPADQVSLAKEAAASAQSLLLRDIRQHPEYASLQEAYPGLVLRDVLAAPMLLKERVVGVIEVVNKRDPVPFNRDDQDLLSAFASQAAIAIENARLYTMTDQELAARLEEMAAMQRLDRELNASLDIDRALRLTLEWALRQSGAGAGWVALHEAGRLVISTWQGYPDNLEGLERLEDGKILLPRGLAPLDEALSAARPVAVYTNRQNDIEGTRTSLHGSGGFLDRSLRALFVPIQRKEEVIAVLGLESASGERWPDHTLVLMRRLSDHAAIAIANAQLYAEVEAANLAKSKFVSFVAHELKNPMASIKGYTELVMGGMAGPVNEMQKTFLNTVRSNVDRMNTIVSDLNDLTKIQVGVLRLEYQSVRVDEIIREASHSMRRQFEEKELQLSLSLPEQLPPAWADPLRVGQILANLMSNALKYTPVGGHVSVSADLDSEGGEQQEPARFVRVWVQDSGIGIPPEDQPFIFEQYFRTEISKETAPGTGLGLNITRSLVEMQGGKIWFESQPGHGSTFYFTLPAVE